MRVLVCGSRNADDYEVPKFIDIVESCNPSVIISGEAKGFDSLARVYAEAFGKEYIGFPADWETHGKRAGPIRNAQMLTEGKPDIVVAFLRKDSKGTKNMIDQALKAGVEVKVIDVEIR